MKNLGIGAVFVCLLGALNACGGAPGDGAYADEEIGSVAEKTLAGDWGSPGTAGVVTAKGNDIAVCKGVVANGETHPGKVWDGSCNIGWGGKTQYVTPFQVLKNKPSYYWWNPVVYNPYYGTWYFNQGLPANAVEGGKVGNTPLPVCIARGDDNRYHPGKYYKDKCNFAYGGQATNNYGREIAMEPNRNDAVLILMQQ